MILLRSVTEDDISELERLAAIAAEKHPGFLNMPSDRDQWREKIKKSEDSFQDKIQNKMDAKYIFVAQEIQSKKIFGMSMISAQHGTNETPHFYFEVSSEQKYSETISTGFIHGTLKLKYDNNGPTEIGGLLVDPISRNTEERIGRQISFVRFLYMAMNKNKFKRRVLAELLPPLTKKGKSPLWEAIGRRFTNMDYTEADNLSAKNKEFIFSLFPNGKIYTTFLSAEARSAIGKVSSDTEPVMHMLKKIGFQYRNQVDPFDGGPHMTAALDEIIPVKNTKIFTYRGEVNKDQLNLSNELSSNERGIVTLKQTTSFKAIDVEACYEANSIYFDLERAKMISVNPGDQVYFMPYY